MPNKFKYYRNWFLIAVIGGSLQIWFSLGHNFLNGGELEWEFHFLNGGYLFFCSSLVLGVAFDVWHEYHANDKFDAVFYHIIIPLFLVVSISFVYLDTCNTFQERLGDKSIPEEVVVKQNNMISQLFLLFLSLIYASLSKMHLHFSKKKENDT